MNSSLTWSRVFTSVETLERMKCDACLPKFDTLLKFGSKSQFCPESESSFDWTSNEALPDVSDLGGSLKH